MAEGSVALSRILVTGAMGRVAAPLIPALQERYRLRLLDRVDGDGDGIGAPLIVGELTDRQVLEQALEGVDGVVHLAGNPDPTAPWHELQNPNVESFVALLAAARRHGVRRVVFASSVHAMGFYEGSGRWPIDPSWPPAPCCAYGATKAFDEALARVYAYQSSVSLIGLRFGLCAPDASPAEAAAGWLRPNDLRRVVVGALTTDVRFGVYHAVSWPSRHRWNIDSAMRDLGYEPERDDGAEEDLEPQSADGHLSTCAPPITSS
jgi:NAD+ dependent glucose-6-phosphate dehydrogenase